MPYANDYDGVIEPVAPIRSGMVECDAQKTRVRNKCLFYFVGYVV